MLKIELDLEVRFDTCQITAHISCFFVRFELPAPAIFDLIEIGIDGVECLKLFEQGDGGFFAYTFYARNVIGRIADNSFIVHHLIWADAKLFDHICIGDVGLVITCEIDRCSLVDKL